MGLVSYALAWGPAASQRAPSQARPPYNHLVMSTRFFTAILVVVLLWTGFIPGQRAMSTATAGVGQIEGPSLGELSKQFPAEQVIAHAADELPVPGHAETLADLQAVLTDRTTAPTTRLTMVLPRPYAALARLGPYLDGPQRPPCADSSVA